MRATAALGRLGIRRAKLLVGCMPLALVVAACQPSSYQYRWDIFFDSVFAPTA